MISNSAVVVLPGYQQKLSCASRRTSFALSGLRIAGITPGAGRLMESMRGVARSWLCSVTLAKVHYQRRSQCRLHLLTTTLNQQLS
jgi:hypothetical protein